MARTKTQGKMILSNGNISIRSKAFFLKKHNVLRIRTTSPFSQPCGFYFTNPSGTKYYELMKQFTVPTKLSVAKEAVGINTSHWNSFTASAIAFNLLEKIPHTWNYQLTSNGLLYIAEVESGNDKFTLKFI